MEVNKVVLTFEQMIYPRSFRLYLVYWYKFLLVIKPQREWHTSENSVEQEYIFWNILYLGNTALSPALAAVNPWTMEKVHDYQTLKYDNNIVTQTCLH